MCHFWGLTVLIQQILLIAPVLMNEKKMQLVEVGRSRRKLLFFFFFFHLL